MRQVFWKVLKAGPFAAAGTSVLALFGASDCPDPSTPTPPPPTCYAPVLVTPTPDVTPTPKEVVPTPTCYDVGPEAVGARSPGDIPAQVDRLDERLQALDKLSRMDRLAPDVVGTTLDRILADIHAIAESPDSGLADDALRARVDGLVAAADQKAAAIRARLAE